jgi:hypothetical protein
MENIHIIFHNASDVKTDQIAANFLEITNLSSMHLELTNSGTPS